MSKLFKDGSFWLSILLTFLFLGIGFCFLHLGLSGYGWFLFVLLPILLGMSIGSLANRKFGVYGALFAFFLFLSMLTLIKAEGYICVLMTIPIAVPLIFIGVFIAQQIDKRGNKKPTDKLSILLLPLFVFLFGAPIEKLIVDNNKAIINVTTERIFPYTPMQVYDAIKSVDTLVANKPFLMRIDLPIPNKCILENEAVGGLRICYFSGGTITEKITQLEKGKILKMDVIDYKLTGRKWLGFKQAIYNFDSIGKDSCKITRITTYTSTLTPRIYWQLLEKWGIEEEHDYVLDNLGNDLKKKYGK